MKYKWYFCKLLVHKRTQISVAILVKETIERKKVKTLDGPTRIGFCPAKKRPRLGCLRTMADREQEVLGHEGGRARP